MENDFNKVSEVASEFSKRGSDTEVALELSRKTELDMVSASEALDRHTAQEAKVSFDKLKKAFRDESLGVIQVGDSHLNITIEKSPREKLNAGIDELFRSTFGDDWKSLSTEDAAKRVKGNEINGKLNDQGFPINNC